MGMRVLIAVVAALLVVPAGATATVKVKQGKAYGARIFPDNFFSVKDKRQLTGRRVKFKLKRDYPVVAGIRHSRCTSDTYSICDGFTELSKLDGFDLQPRVTVPFTGAIKLDSVNDSDFFIATMKGKFVSGLRQLTFEPRTHTLAGISQKFLEERTTYVIRVTRGIRDSKGKPIKACRRSCSARFTTRSASSELVKIRDALDKQPPQKIGWSQDGKDDVFLAASVAPSIVGSNGGIVRSNQVKADPNAADAFKSEAVPNLIPPGSAGYFAFGSFMSPRYQFASADGHQDDPRGNTDGEIPPVPTKQTPQPFGMDRLGVIAVTPNPAQFPPPWPAAVYGPGFTRSKYDIFVSADYNASRGIFTIATDPSGHAYGSKSTATVTANGVPTTFLSYGRGRDLDGDGTIGDGLNDGVRPTGHVQPGGKVTLPSRKPIDGLASGLIQTVVDNMTLGRALKGGLDIPGVGTNLVDPARIYYYGISFGGIYGTMLMGTDPLFTRGLLNVPGGPIVDIARLSSFRSDLADQLKVSKPSFLNGGPGLDGFTEDLPLPTEAPRVLKYPGSFELQELIGQSNWFERGGSPETFAPRIRLRPDPAWASKPKEIAFQTAYGDGTVPNPTAATLYRAGDLFDRVTLYRNDKTPTYSSDPHGWLADPTLAGRTFGQQQLGEFLATGQLTNPNPDWFEVPIADKNNLECLHYPDPQTGQKQVRQQYPASGDCPAPQKP